RRSVAAQSGLRLGVTAKPSLTGGCDRPFPIVKLNHFAKLCRDILVKVLLLQVMGFPPHHRFPPMEPEEAPTPRAGLLLCQVKAHEANLGPAAKRGASLFPRTSHVSFRSHRRSADRRGACARATRARGVPLGTQYAAPSCRRRPRGRRGLLPCGGRDPSR